MLGLGFSGKTGREQVRGERERAVSGSLSTAGQRERGCGLNALECGMAPVRVLFGRYREEEDDPFTENPLASFPSFSDFKTSRVLAN